MAHEPRVALADRLALVLYRDPHSACYDHNLQPRTLSSFRTCRPPWHPVSPRRDGFIAHVGRRSLETARALADVRTWGPLLAVQMRRLGVDSVPIALFIAVFTGIVLALLSSYIFTGTVPLYFVGRAGREDDHDGAGPGADRDGAGGPGRRQHRGRARHDEGDRAGGRAGDAGLRPEFLPGRAAGPRGDADVSGGDRLRDGGRGAGAGWLTAINLLDLSTPEFLKGLKQFYRFKDIWFGLVKSASFGAAVALMGCLRGLDATRPAPHGVGRSTTRAVVLGCEAILVLDAFWALVLL